MEKSRAVSRSCANRIDCDGAEGIGIVVAAVGTKTFALWLKAQAGQREELWPGRCPDEFDGSREGSSETWLQMIEGLSPAVAACACSATSGESKMPLRQWPSFQPYPFKAAREVHQNLQQSFRFARYLHFPNDLARVIHNADARVLDRNIQSRKIVHAALLLLMLEAANADLVFTISLKRSTPILLLSTNSPADYPI